MMPAMTVRPQLLQLPATAPLVRITAGMGSVAQKTWNLRRPVTLLGGRRPAHIVLHNSNVTDAHCVIINTGSEILLKDLHTENGTLQNNVRIDLTVLGDGDVIRLGETEIHVAIQTPNDPDATDWNVAPSQKLPRFDPPCTYGLEGADMQWVIQDAAVLLGSHENAALRLDHADISTRHAVIFRFCDAPAVFDLGSRYGLQVNDQCCSLTSLHHGDTIKAGPFSLHLARIPTEGHAKFIERPHAGELTVEPPTAWQKDLDNKETSLRGKLHDLQRHDELIENRENDLETVTRCNEEESQRLIDESNNISKQLADLEKREADLKKRESAVAQRWARMKTMRCTQCGQPVGSAPSLPRGD